LSLFWPDKHLIEDRLKIEKISWDQETVDHISNRLVSPEEVEEILFNEGDTPLIMRGKEGKYLAYGKTHGGRLLFIVWASKYRKTKIITARDMTEKEKRFHRRRKE
jgi:uncharacterized DUF497 family protein